MLKYLACAAVGALFVFLLDGVEVRSAKGGAFSLRMIKNKDDEFHVENELDGEFTDGYDQGYSQGFDDATNIDPQATADDLEDGEQLLNEVDDTEDK